MEETMTHCGVVERIEGHTVYVRIAQQPACSGCQVKAACTTANGKEQIIEVTDPSGAFRVNEPVRIEGKNSMGTRAVLLAFIVPLALIIATILAGSALQWGEAASALASLILLLPYYIILYLFRNVLKKKFVFTIKKMNPEI
ncbi:MAG: SoxR reducing system RseC family protein [Tannerellaceae bacterium]|jgi:sigma-E factor negative regulatory protein RseC|nr:SoxR reducing system RseC family protein [Tannerellaceae bacterium]